MKYKQYAFGVQPRPIISSIYTRTTCARVGILCLIFIYIFSYALTSNAFAFDGLGTSVAYAGGREGNRKVFEVEHGVMDIQSASEVEVSDPCGLEAVECPEEKGVPDEGHDVSMRKQDAVHPSIAGYDLTSYATNPAHEATVKAIYDAMPEITDKFQADAYIKSKRPKSPITGGMVMRSSAKYNVDPKLVISLMQNDSAFGTAGLGARTNNPGNIMAYDNGHSFTYESWEAGVEGVARWLSKHRN